MWRAETQQDVLRGRVAVATGLAVELELEQLLLCAPYSEYSRRALWVRTWGTRSTHAGDAGCRCRYTLVVALALTLFADWESCCKGNDSRSGNRRLGAS